MQGVDDVEPGNPGEHGKGEQHGQPGEVTGDGEVGTYGREREAHAEDDVAKGGEPLGVAIEEDNEQGHEGEVEAHGIDEPGGGYKQHGADDGKGEGAGGADDACGYLALRGTGVEGIEAAIEVAIECHGGAAGEDHAQEHLYEGEPFEGVDGTCVLQLEEAECEADEGKWQCKYGVAEPDQREVFTDHMLPTKVRQ